MSPALPPDRERAWPVAESLCAVSHSDEAPAPLGWFWGASNSSVFSAQDTAPRPALEPGCRRPQSRGQAVTPEQQDGLLEAQNPSLSPKAVVLRREDGCLLLGHHPKGSLCTPWLSPTAGTPGDGTPGVLRHRGAPSTPHPRDSLAQPGAGWGQFQRDYPGHTGMALPGAGT